MSEHLTLTEEEAELEFTLRRLPHLDFESYADAPFGFFVCREVSPSSFVIRIQSFETDATQYKHFTFGVFPDSPAYRKPVCIPVGSHIFTDAHQAVHESLLALEEIEPGLRPIPHPIPSE